MKIRFCNFAKLVGTGRRFFTKKNVFFMNSHHRSTTFTRISEERLIESSGHDIIITFPEPA